MNVVDPGHEYLLDSLDGEQINHLIFVKREGVNYPGNVGHHPGTTMQEVLRALIHRAAYVNNQIWCEETEQAIMHMEAAVLVLEIRAAKRHSRSLDAVPRQHVISGEGKCQKCGHVGCAGECH